MCRKACQRAVGSRATRHSWQKAAQKGISWALLHKAWWSVSNIRGVEKKKCSWLYKARRCCVIFFLEVHNAQKFSAKNVLLEFPWAWQGVPPPDLSSIFFSLLRPPLSSLSSAFPAVSLLLFLLPSSFSGKQFVHRTERSCSVGRCLGSSEKHLGHPPVNQKAPLGKRSYFQKIQLPEMYCSSIAGTKCPRRNKLMTFPPQIRRPLKQ